MPVSCKQQEDKNERERERERETDRHRDRDIETERDREREGVEYLVYAAEVNPKVRLAVAWLTRDALPKVCKHPCVSMVQGVRVWWQSVPLCPPVADHDNVESRAASKLGVEVRPKLVRNSGAPEGVVFVLGVLRGSRPRMKGCCLRHRFGESHRDPPVAARDLTELPQLPPADDTHRRGPAVTDQRVPDAEIDVRTGPNERRRRPARS